MSKTLWVVMIFERGEFIPTVGVALTRERGLIELAEWRRDMPNDKFRLVKYWPAKLS